MTLHHSKSLSTECLDRPQQLTRPSLLASNASVTASMSVTASLPEVNGVSMTTKRLQKPWYWTMGRHKRSEV